MLTRADLHGENEILERLRDKAKGEQEVSVAAAVEAPGDHGFGLLFVLALTLPDGVLMGLGFVISGVTVVGGFKLLRG